MLNQKLINTPKPTRYQNAAIDYYMGLTESRYLHYGYWEPVPQSGEELTVTRLRVAQEAYAAKLLSFIPQGTNTILDVGCGIGGNAAYLCDRGFSVEGLAARTVFENHLCYQIQLWQLTVFSRAASPPL